VVLGPLVFLANLLFPQIIQDLERQPLGKSGSAKLISRVIAQ